MSAKDNRNSIMKNVSIARKLENVNNNIDVQNTKIKKFDIVYNKYLKCSLSTSVLKAKEL